MFHNQAIVLVSHVDSPTASTGAQPPQRSIKTKLSSDLCKGENSIHMSTGFSTTRNFLTITSYFDMLSLTQKYWPLMNSILLSLDIDMELRLLLRPPWVPIIRPSAPLLWSLPCNFLWHSFDNSIDFTSSTDIGSLPLIKESQKCSKELQRTKSNVASHCLDNS